VAAGRNFRAIYWFNPNCEDQVALGRPGFTPSRLSLLLEADFASLPMFLCAPGDLVLVRQKPSHGFLQKLQAAGFDVPEFAKYQEAELVGPGSDDLRPWGWSPESAVVTAALRANGSWDTLWNDRLRRLYSKAWSAETLVSFLREHPADWFCDERTVGMECSSPEAALAQMDRLKTEGFAETLVKAVFGQAGRNQVRVLGGRPSAVQERWLRKILVEQGSVVVEPRLDKVLDLSVHLDLADPEQAVTAGWTRFFTDGRGQYRGSFIQGELEGLDAELRSFLTPPRLETLCRALTDHVARSAAASGYAGPVGVDALVYRAEDGNLRLKPIVEINPRFTMGRVALHIRRRVRSQRTALWLLLGDRELRASGYPGIASFAEQLERLYPPEMEESQLDAGALFTTDPYQALAFVTLLLVGESAEACVGYLGNLGSRLRKWIDSR